MANVIKTVDVAALNLLCDKLECGDANHRATAEQIRKAMNGTEQTKQLPEGIEWPRFTDGELVKFGDKFIDMNGYEATAKMIIFGAEGFVFNAGYSSKCCRNYGEPVKRPETEVLDADGVPIKVGDTVWNISTGKKYEVLKLPRKGSYQSVMVRGEDGADGFDPDRLTQRKPDTQEDIDNDLKEAFRLAGEQVGDTIWFNDVETLLERVEFIMARQRKLMGGE